MSIEIMRLALKTLEANTDYLSNGSPLTTADDMNHEVIIVLRQAIEQAQKQEPVACGACNGSGWVVRDPDIGTDQECFVCEGTGKNIDTPPPQRQWVGLTDWEAEKLWEAAGDYFSFFEAVEAKLKEKNA